MRPIVNAFRDYWFKPGNADDLGVARFVFFTCTFLIYGVYYGGLDGGIFWQWATVPDGLWLPVSFLKIFKNPPLSPDVAFGFETVLYVGFVFSALGIFTRFSTLITAGIFAILICNRLSFGNSPHRDLLPAAVAIVFACSRSGDGFSIDSLRSSAAKIFLPIAYGWPIRLVQTLLVYSLFSAGISKLRYSGLDWIASDTLKNVLLESYYQQDLDAFSRSLGLGLKLAMYPLLCHVLAGATVFMEILSPIALTKRFRWFIVPLFMMQLGIHLMVTRHFESYLAIYACWIPWRNLKWRISRIKK